VKTQNRGTHLKFVTSSLPKAQSSEKLFRGRSRLRDKKVLNIYQRLIRGKEKEEEKKIINAILHLLKLDHICGIMIE
jgi:hypothetical protein